MTKKYAVIKRQTVGYQLVPTWQIGQVKDVVQDIIENFDEEFDAIILHPQNRNHCDTCFGGSKCAVHFAQNPDNIRYIRNILNLEESTYISSIH